jgi:type VI secretion system protein VasJ
MLLSSGPRARSATFPPLALVFRRATVLILAARFFEGAGATRHGAHTPSQERAISSTSLLDIIVTPLAGAHPFGASVSHDADFDALKAEVGKLGGIDCDVIESAATRILSAKSKDLRALAFLGFACLRQEKWAELADVFDGLHRLAADSFGSLHPERPRARELALRWLSEQRFLDALSERQPQPGDYEHVARLLANLEKLRTVLEQHFPGETPFPSALHKAALGWEKACRPAASEQPAHASPAASTPQSPAQPMDTPKQAQLTARKAALYLIASEPTRPMGYRLLRASRWDLLDKLPPAHEGRTQLEGPAEPLRSSFGGLTAGGQWKPLLDKCEQAFATGSNHLWLDLQRQVVTACERLGEPYRAVAEAVMRETALLIQRLPGIADLSFADGTHFADDATRQWLASAVAPMLPSGAASMLSLSPEAESSLDRESRQATALAAAGQTEQALELLHAAICSSSSRQDNFRRTMLMGRLLVQAGRVEVALPLLESLGDTIDTHHLDAWDPGLAVEALSELLAAYAHARALKGQPLPASLSEKHSAVLSRISRIDPRKAYQLHS